MTDTPDWSTGQLRALTAVFATFVEPAYEGEAERHAALAAAALSDSSLFPAALGVNPMVTVMALAGRVAAAVHADRQ